MANQANTNRQNTSLPVWFNVDNAKGMVKGVVVPIPIHLRCWNDYQGFYITMTNLAVPVCVCPASRELNERWFE